jgi:hypothetical protein
MIAGSKVVINQGRWKGQTGILTKIKDNTSWVLIGKKKHVVNLDYLVMEKSFKFDLIENLFTSLSIEIKYLIITENKIKNINLENCQLIFYTDKDKNQFLDFPLNTIIIPLNNSFDSMLEKHLPILTSHFSTSTFFLIISNNPLNIKMEHPHQIIKKEQVKTWLQERQFSLFEHNLEYYKTYLL